MRTISILIVMLLFSSNTSCALVKSSMKKKETQKPVVIASKHEENESHEKSVTRRHEEVEPKYEEKNDHDNTFADLPLEMKPKHEKEKKHEKSSAGGHHGQHWSYKGNTGPDQWGHLDPEYRACSSGKEQSPINITNGRTKNIGNIRFYYKPSKLNVLNNGHTIQVDYDKGSSIRIDGERYDLLQFHFHTPSEHTIEGIHYPMELHLVHKNKDGKLAVVGLMMVVGKANSLLAPLWENLPSKEGKKHEHLQEKIDIASILPPGERTFRYPGSLTTPPCSEGVKWNVFLSPISISNEQLMAFQDLFKHNSRPVQKLGKRVLWEDSTP